MCSSLIIAPVQLNTISPIASQIMNTMHFSIIFPITLDSGATVSFVREREILAMKIKVHQNGQLATLADEKTRMASKGEIDIEVAIHGIILRLRALVMENLQAICFGGTNFHNDNKITADIAEGTITLHKQFTITQSNIVPRVNTFPPSRMLANDTQLHRQSVMEDKIRVDSQVEEMVIKGKTVNIPHKQAALPGEVISIPLPEPCVKLSRIAVVPSFQEMRSREWPAQVCEIKDGQAVYINSSKLPISHPKHAKFKTLPVVEVEAAGEAAKYSKSPTIPANPMQVGKMLADIKINKNMLSKTQLARLEEIHMRNKEAFDGDLTDGYNHERGSYVASLSFKENSKPPPLKVWVPQYMHYIGWTKI